VSARAPAVDHSKALRFRRIVRNSFLLLTALLGTAILLDHFGCFGYHGDDWASFDGKQFRIERITDRGQLIVLSQGREIPIHLLGTDANATAREYLIDHALARDVILKLEPLQTRDAAGQLLAYVYLTEHDCLNVNIVREGSARADRHQKHTLQAMIQSAEADAKKHHIGLWSAVSHPQ
jgi:endonuclease YncB( thermonuclease family)